MLVLAFGFAVAAYLIGRLGQPPQKVKVVAAHAARATKPLPRGVAAEQEMLIRDILLDANNKPIDLSKKIVGRAVGDSMKDFGLPNNMGFVATPISEEEARSLRDGAMVLIDAPAKGSDCSRRLRRFKAIHNLPEGSIVEFYPDQHKTHTKRPLSKIVGRVDYAIDFRSATPVV